MMKPQMKIASIQGKTTRLLTFLISGKWELFFKCNDVRKWVINLLDVCIAVKTKPLPYTGSSQKGALIMNTRDSDTKAMRHTGVDERQCRTVIVTFIDLVQQIMIVSFPLETLQTRRWWSLSHLLPMWGPETRIWTGLRIVKKFSV